MPMMPNKMMAPPAGQPPAGAGANKMPAPPMGIGGGAPGAPPQQGGGGMNKAELESSMVQALQAMKVAADKAGIDLNRLIAQTMRGGSSNSPMPPAPPKSPTPSPMG